MTTCSKCGEETEFWKTCKPRMSQLGEVPKMMQAVWFKCPHCGNKQFVDKKV